MKEITRIHIAKTPYDIETGAKKTLEAYLKSLEAYSADTEITTDVEIRITEILAERGVQKNGVIAEADVTALKEQLGEPRDFMGDGDMAVGDDALETTDEPGRKLFRDTDRSVLGGVLAGLAAFTKVDVLWVRLIFIIIALASFGTALLVYVVLWLAVPAARTAAERLQMAGRPVTVGSIRELNESEAPQPAASGNGRRVALALLGVMFSFGALISAGMVVAALTAIVFYGHWQSFEGTAGADSFKAAFAFVIASGALFAALMVLSAYASFARKLTKRVAISGGVIIVLGLASFGTAVGLAKHGVTLRNDFVSQNSRTQKPQLPAGMDDVREVKINSPDVEVSYHVTTLKPYASLRAVAQNDAAMPHVTFEKSGKTLLVNVTKGKDGCEQNAWYCAGQSPQLELHGPALAALNATNDTRVEYGGYSQSQLALTVGDRASAQLLSGYVATANITIGREADVSLEEATVGSVNAMLKSSAQLNAGTVKGLSVRDEESCPAGERSARAGVWDITSGELTFNGKKQAAKTMDSGCTEIEIEKETEQ